MKGGKGGRKRKGPGGGNNRSTGGRGTPMKVSTKFPASGPPKKGSRKNPHFGARSTENEDI